MYRHDSQVQFLVLHLNEAHLLHNLNKLLLLIEFPYALNEVLITIPIPCDSLPHFRYNIKRICVVRSRHCRIFRVGELHYQEAAAGLGSDVACATRTGEGERGEEGVRSDIFSTFWEP